MDRKHGLAATIALAGMLAAGCSQIPTSGPVVAGEPVRALDPPPYVAFVAAGPSPEADITEILDGYFDAMSAYHPGYDIARRFLTPEATSVWDPSAQVVVHREARPSIEFLDEDRVQVSFTVSGTVRPDGSYVTTEAGSTLELELRMEDVDGEWRIADPPDGTIISEENFAREFEAHNLCFFDSDHRVFVPEPVYVPKNGQPASILAQMLLDGPSEWLDPAVRTAFPESVTLSVSSVPVESGVATVELSEEAQETQPVQRDQMAAQLACTLGGLPEVTHVGMNADGISLIGQGESTVKPEDYERYNPDRATSTGQLYAVADTGVVVMHPDGTIAPVVGPLGASTDVSEVAVETGGNRGVAVAAEGTQLQLAVFSEDEPRNTILESVGITSPVWDRKGLIWAVEGSAGHGQVMAVHPDGVPVDVQGNELEELDVTRVSVSPDGARMVLVADGKAYVALIVRDGEEPDFVSIERLRPLWTSGVVLDAGWYGAERIAVLAGAEDAAPEVSVVDVFGAVQSSRGPVPGARSLATGPDQRHVVATEDGVLMGHESRTRWVSIGEGRAPAYP